MSSEEKTLRDWLNEVIENMGHSVLLMDGFDEAVIGIGQRINMEPVAVYDYEKMIECLNKEMGYEEAMEYIDYNCAGAWVGEKTPIIVNPISITKLDYDEDEIIEVLEENYCGIGSTPETAISSMWDDYMNDRFTQEWLDEQGITIIQLAEVLSSLSFRLAVNGKVQDLV